MILERFDPRHPRVAQERVALSGSGLTIGRALDNALVLDDPYVDAHHARVHIGADGTAALEDLGALNGIELVGTGRVDRVTLAPGMHLRLGRTHLRVRDAAADVPPALPLAEAAVGAGHWLERRGVGPGLAALVTAWGAHEVWIETSTRDAGTVALTVGVALAAFLAVWAGFWALIGRFIVRRAAFGAHLAVAGLVCVAMLTYGLVHGWVDFLFPARTGFLSSAAGWSYAAISAAGVVVHLGFATTMSARRRWTRVAQFSAGIVVLVLAYIALDEDAFTDVPTFSSTIRLAPAAMVPTTSPEGFVRAAAAARAVADREAAKPRGSSRSAELAAVDATPDD